MFTPNFLRITLVAMSVYVGNSAAAQDSTLSTTPSATLPLVSNERLGTGVPSRLPKVDVQRPVFTIQSGGPVAMPKPQFRPIRETNTTSVTGSESKSTLPMIEQTRPWQKSGNENLPPTERQSPTNNQARSTASPSEQSRIRPVTQTTLQSQPRLAGELPRVERKLVPTTATAPQKASPRPAALPVPTSESPARVLNFSIN